MHRAPAPGRFGGVGRCACSRWGSWPARRGCSRRPRSRRRAWPALPWRRSLPRGSRAAGRAHSSSWPRVSWPGTTTRRGARRCAWPTSCRRRGKGAMSRWKRWWSTSRASRIVARAFSSSRGAWRPRGRCSPRACRSPGTPGAMPRRRPRCAPASVGGSRCASSARAGSPTRTPSTSSRGRSRAASAPRATCAPPLRRNAWPPTSRAGRRACIACAGRCARRCSRRWARRGSRACWSRSPSATRMRSPRPTGRPSGAPASATS